MEEQGQNRRPDLKYITKNELMRRTGRSRSTIQRMLRRGMPSIKYYGGVLVFCWQDVVKWLNENKYAPPSVIAQMESRAKEE